MTNNEWQEPRHPLRVWVSNAEAHRGHPVFAVRIQDRGLEYLTINGQFFTSQEIAFAEYFVNGEWIVIKRVARVETKGSPTSDM